ncbi:MAG: hypothetical protein ACRECH_18230 [Nitrososphaerales archaeon]
MIINRERWPRETIPPIAAYVALDLVLTTVFILVSPSGADTGAIRPSDTILPKIVELILVGIAIGSVASFAFRKIDLNIFTLSVAFVVLLDVDHVPAALGFQEPIRPAHTIAFLLALLAVLAFTIKKQAEVELIAISAFLGHMAADTGEFALFAPFSFAYSALDPYRVSIAAGAVAFALLAGYVKYRRYRSASRLLMKEAIVNENQTQNKGSI